MDHNNFKRPQGNESKRDQDSVFKRPSASSPQRGKQQPSAQGRDEKAAGKNSEGGLGSFFKKLGGGTSEKDNKEKRRSESQRRAENYDQLTFTQKRKAYEDERAEKQQQRRLRKIRKNVRKRVSGKPDIPKDDITVPGMLGKFTGKLTLLLIVILVCSIVFVGGSGLGVMIGYITTATEVSNDLFTIKEQTSYIYDKDGKTIATLTGSSNINRELVRYEQISDNYLDEAFIAIEDRTFRDNIGIDPRRIISAVVEQFLSSGSGHGGSTITQQTIKMLTEDDEVSYQRKVQEWYRAVKLSENLSKSEIMNLYLNLVPMGNNYVGVQSAAKAYFGKNAKDLNLAECAFLAGIPKSPSSFNPRTELGRNNAQRRQRVVLDAMLQSGFISEKQFTDALNYELVYNHDELKYTGMEINSYFEEYCMDEVINDLVEQKGISENVAFQTVMNGGVRIYSTLDSDAQKELDAMFKDRDRFQTYPEMFVNSPEVPQAGVVLLDNRNQSIVAMQGGYGEKKANMVFNRATDAYKQPGSSFKPLAVYAPAIELNIVTGATIIVDEPVRMAPGSDALWPVNAYGGYYGNMTMRDCLKISNNVPAVKVLALVGIENSRSFLKQMGLPLSDEDVGLAMGIGSLNYGVTPLQMANAFMTFPNGGQYTKAKPYSKVTDADGNVLLENSPEKDGSFTQVFEPSTAYMMQRLMEEVMRGPTGGQDFTGTGANAGLIYNEAGEYIPVSAKTGTTDEEKDEWIIQQTPYYTCAAWYGFDNRIKSSYIIWDDLFLIHHLVGDFMRYVHRDLEPIDWNRPADIIELQISTITGQLATAGCGGYTRTEYFKAGSPITPTQTCPRHSNSGAPINYLLTDAGHGR